MIALLADAAVPAGLCAAIITGCARERRQARKAPKPEAVRVPDAVVLAAYESDFERGVYAREPRRARRRP